MNQPTEDKNITTAQQIAIDGDDLETEDVCHRRAVGQTVRTARVGADVAPDRARSLGRGVGGEMQAERGDLLR